MTNPVRGIDWDAIFKRRPDLSPPGYHETIAALYQEDQTDDECQEGDS